MLDIIENITDKNGQPIFVLGTNPVKPEERTALLHGLAFLTPYRQIKEAYEIGGEENFDLKRFLEPTTLNRELELSAHHVTAVRTGNKLLFNFCSVLKLIVEKIE